MAENRRFLRLKPEFLSSFDWKKSGVKRQEFATWARKKCDPPVRIDERNWSPMKAGEPVPYDMIYALSMYFIEALKLPKGKETYKLVIIASECAAPDTTDSEGDPKPGREPVPPPKNAWRMNFSDLFAMKSSLFGVPQEAYCRNESDLMDAALMVMYSTGYRATKSHNNEVCIQHSIAEMKRTPEGYAKVLVEAWKANENSVLFTIQRNKDGTSSRIGVSIIFPMTRRYYQNYRNGETNDISLTGRDVQAKSLYLYLAAVSENHKINLRSDKGRRSLNEINTIMFQMASLCPRLDNWSANPTLVSHFSEPESIARLKSYNFKPVGTRTKLTNLEVVEFAPPSGDNLMNTSHQELAQYLALRSTLMIYQFIAGKQRLSDD